MTTTPKYDAVEVRPLKRVFIDGRMIGPGERTKTYMFTGDELPEKTILASEPPPAETAAKPFADTKPADARAAVRTKAKGGSGLSEME